MTSFTANYLPKALPPVNITVGVRASMYEFGGRDSHIQSITEDLRVISSKRWKVQQMHMLSFLKL